MKPDLNELIDAARAIKMTPDQQAEQRRSFAYGNCHLDNERVTRDMVEETDRKLRKIVPGVPG